MPKKPAPRYPQKYGPGVMDPEEYEAAQKVVKSKTSKYGPGLIDDHPDNLKAEETPDIEPTTPPEDPPPEDDPEKGEETDDEEKGKGEDEDPTLSDIIAKYASDDGYLSITNLKGLLKEMPEAFDRVFAWEVKRVDGARIGAMEHLLELEEAKEVARDLVVETLKAKIAAARGG